ncbi:hypothetical protein [Flavobacterium nackdongense]|uniref:Uncharacterized protein n=1 Tax=Flavobacterium nackdongense TaxID=2547394 RepID=A0A4P6YFC1_9FLAO|nr:hypothetical protein [Flavobacterium nackdongense]QBN19594.1 hypothetical protein E1750_12560 [Flavobacterium nackdongense]
MITYYIIGLFTGVFVTAFFTGKELYKYYTKYSILQKKLDRILKLDDDVKEIKTLKSTIVRSINVG